jgi:hypothetical protein
MISASAEGFPSIRTTSTLAENIRPPRYPTHPLHMPHQTEQTTDRHRQGNHIETLQARHTSNIELSSHTHLHPYKIDIACDGMQMITYVNSKAGSYASQ